MDFKDQYKHPKWQELRLRVMSIAKFKCETCGSDEDQLQVHHRQYLKGHKIWEYQENQLECLCDTCHEDAHESKSRVMNVMGSVPSVEWCSLASLLEGFYLGCGEEHDPMAAYVGILADVAHTSLNIYQIVSLIEQLREKKSSLTVAARKSSGGGFD